MAWFAHLTALHPSCESCPNPLYDQIVVAISDSETIVCDSGPGRPEDVIVVGTAKLEIGTRHFSYVITYLRGKPRGRSAPGSMGSELSDHDEYFKPDSELDARKRYLKGSL